MTIIRSEHQKNYVIINKEILEDPNISLKSKGFWTYCMSKPDDWEFHVSQLETVLKEGEDAIYSSIKELIENGYCKRVQPNEGKFGSVDYVMYEKKQPKETPLTEKSEADGSEAEKPELLRNDSHLGNEAIKNKETPPTPSRGDVGLVSYGSFVKLKIEVYEELCSKNSKAQVDQVIEEINDYLAANGKKPYKDYGAAIRNWLRRRQSSTSKAFFPNQIDRAPRDSSGNKLENPYAELFK